MKYVVDGLTKVDPSEVMHIIELVDEHLAYQRKPLRQEDQILSIPSNNQGDSDKYTDETRPTEALTTPPCQEL